MDWLWASLAATTAMTLFSYVVSALSGKWYNEPQLLQFVFSQSRWAMSSGLKFAAAWILHYVIGLVFVMVLDLIVETPLPELAFTSTLIFGTIIGTIGILGWEMMFRWAVKPVETDRAGYYSQLFIAHLIFAFVTMAFYAGFYR